jgi:hypothetical protein
VREGRRVVTQVGYATLTSVGHASVRGEADDCRMQTIPGSNCAALLVACDVPFTDIVRALMSELRLSYEEAAAAASSALERSGV